MENISIDTIYSLLDKFDIFNELLTRYGTALLIAAAVFALLNCFFGYALRKLWSVLLGFGIGASGGMLLATYTDQNFNMTLGVTLGLGFIFGLLALLLYRIGTFFLIIGFLGFSLYKLLNPTDLIMLLFLLGIAVVIALIGVPFERITVILITSVCGALTAVTLAYDFQETDYDLVMWMIVLFLLGWVMIGASSMSVTALAVFATAVALVFVMAQGETKVVAAPVVSASAEEEDDCYEE